MRSLRTFRVSPKLFRRLSWAVLASLFLIVTSGAIVRLTASGLGCDNWPRCGDTPFPEKDFHAVVEFSNRALGLIPITLSLVLWLAARRTAGLQRGVVWLSLGVFLGTIAQGPLGGLTVISDLHPLLVMSHFLLAMLVLGGAMVVAVEASGLEHGRAAPLVPSYVQIASAVVAVAALATVVSGAFVTAAGPHSGGADIQRLGSPLTAIWVHVRVTAVLGITFLAVLAYLTVRRRQAPPLFAAALGLLVLLLAQGVVGETQYRTELPWWLVLVHVGLAAAAWAWSVALAALCFRPPLPFARASTSGVSASAPAPSPGHEVGTVS